MLSLSTFPRAWTAQVSFFLNHQIPKHLHKTVFGVCGGGGHAETAKPHISEPHHTALSRDLIRVRASVDSPPLPLRGSVLGPDHSSPTTGSPEKSFIPPEGWRAVTSWLCLKRFCADGLDKKKNVKRNLVFIIHCKITCSNRTIGELVHSIEVVHSVWTLIFATKR